MIAARPVLQAGGARARSSAWRSQVLPGAALPAPLFGCHIGFEGTTFKPIELIAILDLGALFEQAPFYKCGHASDDVDPIDRFAKKFAGSVIGRLVASTMPTAGSPPGQVVSGPTHWR
jgi:hypothetical protein